MEKVAAVSAISADAGTRGHTIAQKCMAQICASSVLEVRASWYWQLAAGAIGNTADA